MANSGHSYSVKTTRVAQSWAENADQSYDYESALKYGLEKGLPVSR